MPLLLISFCALVALVALFGFLSPKKLVIERDIVVGKPLPQVFALLRLLDNKERYAVWKRKDPALKLFAKGTDGTVGFVSVWEGNKAVGAGEQEIKKIVDGERIELELRFTRPFVGSNRAYATTGALTENATRVTWGMLMDMPFPVNILCAVMGVERKLCADIDEELAGLKRLIEGGR